LAKEYWRRLCWMEVLPIFLSSFINIKRLDNNETWYYSEKGQQRAAEFHSRWIKETKERPIFFLWGRTVKVWTAVRPQLHSFCLWKRHKFCWTL
jgi:hypothetical protein